MSLLYMFNATLNALEINDSSEFTEAGVTSLPVNLISLKECQKQGLFIYSQLHMSRSVPCNAQKEKSILSITDQD